MFKDSTFFNNEKGYYIKITQDGIARIDPHTPVNLKGVHIDGLQTCFGIILVGSNGKISAIHKTTAMSYHEISEEIKWVGDISKICVAYDPKYDNSRTEYETIDFLMNKLYQIIKNYKIKPILQAYQSNSITINRHNEINLEDAPALNQLPPYPNLRDTINTLNNYFSSSNESLADRQFINNQWAPLPKLSTDVLNIYRLYPNRDDTDIDNISSYLKQLLFTRQEPFFQTIRERCNKYSPETALIPLFHVAKLMQQLILDLQNFDYLDEKEYVVENQNLALLNELTGVRFFGHLNANYYVDALCYFHNNSDADEIEELLLQLDIAYERTSEETVLTSSGNMGFIHCLRVKSINIEEMNADRIKGCFYASR